MTLEMLLVFLPACFALNMVPGPSNLLSVSNASRYGFASACVAGAGRQVAFVLMIAVAASGLAVVLKTSATLFNLIKIVGAAYLLYLAFKIWRAPVNAAPEIADVLPSDGNATWAMARQEFLAAAGNPKAILIFTAFFPQFVDTAQPAFQQFSVLGMIFLTMECIAIAAYCWVGSHLGKWFSAPERKRVFNRGCALLLGAAGAGLLLSRKATA